MEGETKTGGEIVQGQDYYPGLGGVEVFLGGGDGDFSDVSDGSDVSD